MLTVPLLLTVRRWSTSPQAPQAIRLFTEARPYLPKTLAAFIHVIMVTGAIQPIMHSASNPLPFVPQILFQALTVAFLVVVQAAPAAAILQHTPFSAELSALCEHLNRLAVVTSGCCADASDVALLRDTCSAHGQMLLILFADFYFGFSLPTYVAYRLEQHLKWQLQLESQQQQQLHQQQQEQERHPADGAGCPARAPAVDENQTGVSQLAADLGVLVALAPATWLMVILLRPRLVHIMWPTTAAAMGAGGAAA
jgi:hypothetical protein